MRIQKTRNSHQELKKKEGNGGKKRKGKRKEGKKEGRERGRDGGRDEGKEAL